MARECGKMVEGGGRAAAYPCEVMLPEGARDHQGPCATKDIPQTQVVRDRWLASVANMQAGGTEGEPTLAAFQGRPQTSQEAWADAAPLSDDEKVERAREASRGPEVAEPQPEVEHGTTPALPHQSTLTDLLTFVRASGEMMLTWCDGIQREVDDARNMANSMLSATDEIQRRLS